MKQDDGRSHKKNMVADDEKHMEFDRSQAWKVDNEKIKSDLLDALEMPGKEYLHKKMR